MSNKVVLPKITRDYSLLSGYESAHQPRDNNDVTRLLVVNDHDDSDDYSELSDEPLIESINYLSNPYRKRISERFTQYSTSTNWIIAVIVIIAIIVVCYFIFRSADKAPRMKGGVCKPKPKSKPTPKRK